MAKQRKSSAAGNEEKLTPQQKRMRHGIEIARLHPLFGRIYREIYSPVLMNNSKMGKNCAAKVTSDGIIYLNKDCDLPPEEWAFSIAHNQLHLCFGHFDAENMPGYRQEDGTWVVSCNIALWNMACDLYIDRFLREMKFGSPMVPQDILDSYPHGNSELELYQKLADAGADPMQSPLGTSSVGKMDMIGLEEPLVYAGIRYNRYTKMFAHVLNESVRSALNAAADGDSAGQSGIFEDIVRRLMNQIPLLGALASGFHIVDVSSRISPVRDVEVAAVDVTKSEIYVNRAARLTDNEWCFVLAHEYLHAGLQHHARRQGRDPYLWNVACDYVVNGWLMEMGIGKMPEIGLLYDETLKGCSAEEIYDRLITDMRKNSKLRTFRGYGMGDIIADGWTPCDSNYVTLDEFYRNALRSGLEYAVSHKRGLIPAGLVEEIRALSMPPIPWDVELARWFETHFLPPESHRSYARPSRRQSSTPDIPRAGWIKQEVPENSRTFGVIIDTSGSMPPTLIGLALGAAASYSAARDVPCIRLVFCDAAATDMGYVTPDEIAGRVEVTGRGGTRLQPAVDLLEKAQDFPSDAPILIITDGGIEPDLRVRREHAFLVPNGCYLPFRARGEVFYFKEREGGM